MQKSTELNGEILALAQYAKEGKDSLASVQLGALDTAVVTASTGAPREHLVDLAKTIQDADVTLRAATGSKLQVIVDQIRLLQMQARIVLEETKRDADLHRAACNFQKRPGSIYHLYKRDLNPEDDGVPYLSLLSPQEWGRSKPNHSYLGSYRLEHDQTWTPVEKIRQREDNNAFVQNLLGENIIKYTDTPLFSQLTFTDQSLSASRSIQQAPFNNNNIVSNAANATTTATTPSAGSLTSTELKIIAHAQQHQQQIVISDSQNPMALFLQSQSTLTSVPSRQLGTQVPLPNGLKEPENWKQ